MTAEPPGGIDFTPRRPVLGGDPLAPRGAVSYASVSPLNAFPSIGKLLAQKPLRHRDVSFMSRMSLRKCPTQGSPAVAGVRALDMRGGKRKEGWVCTSRGVQVAV